MGGVDAWPGGEFMVKRDFRGEKYFLNEKGFWG